MSQEKEIYIFLGPPGAGKGSLAMLCAKNIGWGKLSTGNLCRKHISEQTEIGIEIDFAIKSGKLISDDLISLMVEDWFVNNFDNTQTVILDGYPRTLAQAEILEKLLEHKFSSWQLHIVRLTISDDVVINRLFTRYICSNKSCQIVYSLADNSPCAPKVEGVCDYCQSELVRRADDTKEAVCKRLLVYHQHEKDLIDFYKSRGRFILEVNVEKSPSAVFNELKKYVGIKDI